MDIKSYKQKKERGVSVEDVIQSFSGKHGDYDSIIIVAKCSDGNIDIAYSTANDAELVGLLEVAKSELVECIRDS